MAKKKVQAVRFDAVDKVRLGTHGLVPALLAVAAFTARSSAVGNPRCSSEVEPTADNGEDEVRPLTPGPWERSQVRARQQVYTLPPGVRIPPLLPSCRPSRMWTEGRGQSRGRATELTGRRSGSRQLDPRCADVQVAGLACSGSQPDVRGFDSLRRCQVRPLLPTGSGTSKNVAVLRVLVSLARLSIGTSRVRFPSPLPYTVRDALS